MPDQAKPARGRIVVEPELCHACQSCMVACSLVHEAQVIPSRARLQVTVDPFKGNHSIRYCHQCRNAPCARACANNAIHQVEAGHWEVDESLCDGCGACAQACPFHTLKAIGVALKCDTCHGNPACVASCPSGTLTWRTDAK